LCGNICLYTDIQLAKHLEVCNESERECWFKDSGCTRLLKGRDMVAHLQVCGEEEHQCPYWGNGCRVTMKRRDFALELLHREGGGL
jgi:hypothetical protein